MNRQQCYYNAAVEVLKCGIAVFPSRNVRFLIKPAVKTLLLIKYMYVWKIMGDKMLFVGVCTRSEGTGFEVKNRNVNYLV